MVNLSGPAKGSQGDQEDREVVSFDGANRRVCCHQMPVNFEWSPRRLWRRRCDERGHQRRGMTSAGNLSG
jgi:hypothetical protein